MKKVDESNIKDIRIDFLDFWPNLDKTNSFFQPVGCN